MKKKLIIIISSTILIITAVVMIFILSNHKKDNRISIILDYPYKDDYVLIKSDKIKYEVCGFPLEYTYTFDNKDDRDKIYEEIKKDNHLYKDISDNGHLLFYVDNMFFAVTKSDSFERNRIITYPLTFDYGIPYFMGYSWATDLVGTITYESLDDYYEYGSQYYNFFDIKSKEDILSFYNMINPSIVRIDGNEIYLKTKDIYSEEYKITLYDTYYECSKVHNYE